MNEHNQMALLALNDSELMEMVRLDDAEFDELENQLGSRAACLGWTGDPMRQPLETVAAIVRGLVRNRRTFNPSAQAL